MKKNTVIEDSNCFQKIPQHGQGAVTALHVDGSRGFTVKSAVRTGKQKIYARGRRVRHMAQAISGRPGISGAKGTL